MRIKQIELNGFKSFMDRTVLQLPAGVTAIVGPNGCGKSNVVDAIRWVLGEQSPKHLRGTAMEDVVFAGNAENGPLGMAEVSLLLERDDSDLAQAAAGDAEELVGGGLPPELANAAEVLVTRRYFRSGESEYFINRAACRLKDITELFLGTGVGTKAYAIIEQGRVDQLVNAKPEELRLFLEEAAGTTRFRSRKVAAERKMTRTRENLVRVQDVLRELERQMASLERQARRAEEYHRIKGELRDLDVRVMATRQRAWQADIDRLAERLTRIQEEEALVLEAIRRAQGASAEARATRQRNTEALHGLEEELTRQRLLEGEQQSRASALGTRAVELAERAAQAEAEAEDLRARVTGIASEAEVLRQELERLRADTPAAESACRAAEERLTSLEAAGRPLEAAVENAKDTLMNTLAEEMRLRNMADVLQQRRDELAGRRRKVDDEQQALGERLRTNTRGIESARARIVELIEERDRLGIEREALLASDQAFATREADQLDVVERARAEATRLRLRAESLRDLEARLEGCTRGVGSLLGRGEGASVLLASVLRVPAHLERAVAAALGTRLGQVVVPDTRTAIEAVAWLRDSAGGSATVMPREAERRAAVIVPPGRRLVDQIEVDPQHWALAEALLGHVLLAEDLDAALEVWRAATHPVTVVTASGEAIDALGAVTGGSEAPLEETLLARARELRELEAAITDATELVAREESALAVMRDERAASTERALQVDERLRALQLEVVATEKDRERLDEDRIRIDAELEVSALEAGSLAGEDGEVATEIEGLVARLAGAEQAVADRRLRLTQAQDSMTRWREDHAASERSRTAAAVAAAALAERLRGAEAGLQGAHVRHEETVERLARLVETAAGAAAGAEQARGEATEAEAASLFARGRAAGLESERQRLAAAIAESDALLSADDGAERAGRERLEALREERGHLEITTTERRMALEHLAEQLAERYSLGLEALEEVSATDDGLDEERAERVEALRARLQRLGDVNPGALAELEELRERRTFLDAQRADLEGSLDDLRRTIAKLTRTSRTRFEETFAAANEKLADVFPKLFPNGKARLELTEPAEDGEPGVEIVVQPAGKKLQSLSLLSGGEKALTAVALILSLFLIRPTPFCLLDEVDAPLDEANIGRFNELIRHMAGSSQFVLITHNRRTMEVADTLYGITMEQAGASKVVSVRLREAA
jgi:chromosome segregation protein